MASQLTKKRPPDTKSDPDVLRVGITGDKPQAAQLAAHLARAVLNGMTSNAVTARTFAGGMFGDLDVTECVATLSECAARVHGGDLEYLETTLTAQAVNLDAMFNGLAKRAAHNMGVHLDATERYLRLALKAQSQCRATLETLAAIKNPPVVFARQANITSGPQQVNNGATPSTVTSTHTPAHAGETKPAQTELLELQHGERMDTGKTGTASGAHPHMETVGAFHRP